ncbi:MAG: aminomethyl-transferring glycine dehydrogenase subunit GcvPB [Tannerella sp.]|jgi:glycine dehydrogenase subunit 2|nr:aminomethyl-transferring glycine dehydrogenase subunit GcvPB [Tannerella sp.]
MRLLFEISKEGHGCDLLPAPDVPEVELPARERRRRPPALPQLSEVELSRHYTRLMKRTFGVNSGFYPLGSCTMKYNPRINEEMASLPGFTDIHPLQPEHTVQGCMEVFSDAEKALCEITGMDAITFQPAAGAHGEFAGVLLIKAWHASRGDTKRTKIIIPDAAHGTNPASATMAGFTVVNIPSNTEGCVDVEKLREAAGDDTAGLMLTNPNTLGLFDRNILEITKIVHDAGGLNYYDGANLNAIMGIVRPGDMGFDVVHLNIHKTFSTPHGGGGPGSGPTGCKAFLSGFLPVYRIVENEGRYGFSNPDSTIGSVKAFYGHFLVVVRALTYIKTLGAEGIRRAAIHAVLNANYMRKKLSEYYDPAYEGLCMHEFVLTLQKVKEKTGVTALDVVKTLLENGIHPPTMYFPLIVREALMIEPTETESKETIDEAIGVFRKIYDMIRTNPEQLHEMPLTTPVRRPDEVGAARHPRLTFPEEQPS